MELRFIVTLSYLKRPLYFFKAILQKIMVKNFRYFHQLSQVDTFPFEHLVDIRLLTKNAFGKPIDRTTLPSQFRLYHVADVYVFHFKSHILLILKIYTNVK